MEEEFDAVKFWAYAYACCIVMNGNMELDDETQKTLVKDLAEKMLAEYRKRNHPTTRPQDDQTTRPKEELNERD